MKKILAWAVVVFVFMQFIPVDYNNPKISKADNFVDINKTPKNIEVLLRNACYDCHSNETVYPTYSKVAPISWLVKDHINEGRAYLNFSEWGKQTLDIQKNALEKSILEVQQYSMPLPSYISKHPKANLNNKDRQELMRYFQSLENDLTSKSK